jgi:hypothetical protein
MKRLNLHRVLPWLLAVAVLCLPAIAQEQSVKPGINKSYEQPDAEQWTKTFEREGRVVYDHRKELVADCQLKPGMTVGDIGAGTGLFTLMLSKEVGSKGLSVIHIIVAFPNRLAQDLRIETDGYFV